MLHCRAGDQDEFYHPGERRSLDQIRNKMCDHCYYVLLNDRERMARSREKLSLLPTC